MVKRNGSAEVVLLVVLGIPAAFIIGSALLMGAAMWIGQPDKSEQAEIQMEEVHEK